MISLDIAKATSKLPSYTKKKGLDEEKLKNMVLQLLQNAGKEGARRGTVMEYLEDVLPYGISREKQERYVGRLLVKMRKKGLIVRKGIKWVSV